MSYRPPCLAVASCFALALASVPASAAEVPPGLADAQKVVDDYSRPPTFKPPGPPFDIRKCASGNRMISIPNTSTNQFVKGVMDSEVSVGKEIGLPVMQWQNEGQPSQWIQGFDYAISNRFTIIDLISGINPAVVEPQIRKASEAGIKTFVSIYYDVSQPPDKLVAGNLPLNYHRDMGAVLADWMAVHTEGQARAIVIKSEEVLPTAPLVAGIHDEFEKNCPGCSVVQEINVGITEWATKIQSSLQSALLAHPEANYVVPIYDSMTQFVTPAIALTGRARNVKVATVDGTPYVLDLVRQGRVEMDIGENLDWAARATIDGYMRKICGLPMPAELGVPFYIFDSHNAADAGVPAKYNLGYGDAYRAGFQKLWMLPN